jgi:hypothetical protein
VPSSTHLRDVTTSYFFTITMLVQDSTWSHVESGNGLLSVHFSSLYKTGNHPGLPPLQAKLHCFLLNLKFYNHYVCIFSFLNYHIVVLDIFCDIYKSAYKRPWLNSPHPSFFFYSPSPILRIVSTFFHFHTHFSNIFTLIYLFIISFLPPTVSTPKQDPFFYLPALCFQKRDSLFHLR